MCLELTQGRAVASVEVAVGPCFPIPMPDPPERYKFMFKLPVDRGILLEIVPKDGRQNPISLDDIDGETIVVTSSNTDILSVELLENQKIKVVPTGTLGTAQVNVEFNVPSMKVPFTGLLEITVVPGAAASFSINPVPDSMFPV